MVNRKKKNREIKSQSNYNDNGNQFIRKNENFPNLNIFLKPIIGTEEIRQYVYCKRKIFFRYVMRAPMKKTYKMEYGEKKHEKLQKLSNKEDDKSQKYFNVYLKDFDAGLVGIIDYFEFDGNEAFPIEIKSGNIPPESMENPDKLQVASQAILIEKNFDYLVKKIRIFYTKVQEFVDYPIRIEEKLRVLEIIDEIRYLLASEEIPEPTKHNNKCTDCECVNYCLRA